MASGGVFGRYFMAWAFEPKEITEKAEINNENRVNL
jgi:hypothetical protein